MTFTYKPWTFYEIDENGSVIEYFARISHHSILPAPPVWVGYTQRAAKINATREFGGGDFDHVIEIEDDYGDLVASRRIGDKQWTQYVDDLWATS